MRLTLTILWKVFIMAVLINQLVRVCAPGSSGTVTIKDVTSEVGVSVITVSAALAAFHRFRHAWLVAFRESPTTSLLLAFGSRFSQKPGSC
jgi:hypothetical protein